MKLRWMVPVGVVAVLAALIVPGVTAAQMTPTASSGIAPVDYRIAVPGSMLAAASGGSSLIAGQLANGVKYDPFWDVIQGGGISDDATVQAMEQQFESA